MKTVESSAVFQPKQWAEKEARKTIENKPNPNLCPRTLFEVPLTLSPDLFVHAKDLFDEAPSVNHSIWG